MGGCASRPKDLNKDEEAPVEAPTPKKPEAEAGAEVHFFPLLVSISRAMNLKVCLMLHLYVSIIKLQKGICYSFFGE